MNQKGDIMASMVTANLLTRADLDALPDDGLRHELIDGHFVMTPAPGTAHQTIAIQLASQLNQALRGSGLKVLTAPFDVVLGSHVVEPDIVVAPKANFTAQDLPVPPLLVVEILSPTTQHLDRGRKREIYAEAGVPHYWIVDPDEPAITIYELNAAASTDRSSYREAAQAAGDDSLDVEQPVALRITPAELRDD